MRTEQRLVLFVVLSIAMMWGMQFLMDRMGLIPHPPKPQAAAELAQPEAEPEAPAPVAKDAVKAKADEQKPIARASKIPLFSPDKLVMGSVDDKAKDGYRLELRFDQKGAGVASVASSRIEAEFVEGRPRNRPLELIQPDPTVPASFTLALTVPGAIKATADAGVDPVKELEIPLDSVLWDVVLDDQGRAVRPIQNGQEIRFRTAVPDPAVTLTKTFRLYRGQDGFELELGFESPDAEHSLVYRLAGAHGIPIEGEWYTGTFRDVFFGRIDAGGVKIDTYPANKVVDRKDDPEKFGALPLKYTGVENQYFAVFLEPNPIPTTLEQSWDKEAWATVIHEPKDRQKADVAVQILSKSLKVGPNRTQTHTYRIFAGPKTAAALAPYGATDLSKYRKGWSLWFLGDLGASWVATLFIAPMLERIYAVTAYVAHFFGGTRGNYGIAIILLTMTVRLILFPLGRKQAQMAKKMQELQPQLVELKEKYKDDKEKITKETFALYKQHGANPMGGCLPALIQLPILIGLWQALNNSVALRHSSFLWINNLAAPDMLFKFPIALPLIGGWLGPYFNALPLVVVALMMVQTKLFSPPAVTEEAKMQQKTMKFMMVFMAFMFYKVPSGLGIYFITSSLWQISERLLLPKTLPKQRVTDEEIDGEKGRSGGSGGKGRGGSGGDGPDAKDRGGSNGTSARGWFSGARERLEQLVEDASKDKTHRNNGREKDRERSKTRPRPGRRL